MHQFNEVWAQQKFPASRLFWKDLFVYGETKAGNRTFKKVDLSLQYEVACYHLLFFPVKKRSEKAITINSFRIYGGIDILDFFLKRYVERNRNWNDNERNIVLPKIFDTAQFARKTRYWVEDLGDLNKRH